MTDREKIIKIIESNKLCVLDMDCNDCPYRDNLNKTDSCGSYILADALIAAGIGDVSKHRLFISKDGTVCKQLYCGEEVEQIAKERDEYKHRAEVAERQAILLSKWLAEKTRKDYPWRAWFDAAQKQAEKEFAEEDKR